MLRRVGGRKRKDARSTFLLLSFTPSQLFESLRHRAIDLSPCRTSTICSEPRLYRCDFASDPSQLLFEAQPLLPGGNVATVKNGILQLRKGIACTAGPTRCSLSVGSARLAAVILLAPCAPHSMLQDSACACHGIQLIRLVEGLLKL